MAQLVAFVGHDPTENEYSPQHGGRLRADARFFKGQDTLTIAREMGMSDGMILKEHTILKWISIERSRRLGLPDPY